MLFDSTYNYCKSFIYSENESKNSTGSISSNNKNKKNLHKELKEKFEGIREKRFHNNPYLRKKFEQEGVNSVVEYLSTDQQIAIAGISAGWGCVYKGHPLYNKLGQHLYGLIPGDRQIEITGDEFMGTPDPTNKNRQITQINMRKAKGRTVELLWHKHLEMSVDTGRLIYFPGIRDCHSYVQDVFEASGLDPDHGLSRYKPNPKTALNKAE